MLASLLCTVTALVCRVSTLTEERTVTVVALRVVREMRLNPGSLGGVFQHIFQRVVAQIFPLEPDTPVQSFPGLNLTDISLGRWNNASSFGFR